MHRALQEILNKQFPDRVISKNDTPLFDAISKVFSELSEQNKRLDMRHQQDEASAIALDKALADVLKMLGHDESSHPHEKASLHQLVDRTDKIKELIGRKKQTEQQLKDEIST